MGLARNADMAMMSGPAIDPTIRHNAEKAWADLLG